MKEYVIDGEKYKYTGKYWIDSHFTVAPKAIIAQLNHLMSEDVDFDSMSHKELIDFGARVKEEESPEIAIKCFDKILSDNPEINEVKNILPRYTSALRINDKPSEAVIFADSYIRKYGKEAESYALYTSIAAAHIDLGQLEQARKKANKAKAMLCGGSTQELINVYMRLKAMERTQKLE